MRRTLWVAHAWLMAVLTVAGGLPHRQCVCPDGGVKWFCLDPSDDGCCCKSACCAAAGDGEGSPSPVARACCRHHKGREAQAPNPGHELRDTPCCKTWVPSSLIAEKPARESGPAKAAEASPLVAALLVDTGWTPDGVCEPVWRADRAPPPTDRIILFQRLLL